MPSSWSRRSMRYLRDSYYTSSMKDLSSYKKTTHKNARNFVLGLIAGSAALLVAAAFRIFAGGLFIPELASQTLFSLTPGQVESFSVETFGSLAKYTAFTIAILFNLILYGGLAILLHKVY